MKLNTGGQSPSDDDFENINTDDEENQHDQLPSPEEYKARMDGNSYNGNPNNVDNPQDGDDNHDLPTVDQYKRDLSFREKEGDEKPRTRAGLYTFLCLVLLLIIVTA